MKAGGSGLNNIHEHGVLELDNTGSSFAQYFGFSEKEIKEQILDKVLKEEFIRNKSGKSKDTILYDKLK